MPNDLDQRIMTAIGADTICPRELFQRMGDCGFPLKAAMWRLINKGEIMLTSTFKLKLKEPTDD